MNDKFIAKFADKIAEDVSKQILDGMAKFVDALEGVVRENEALRARVEDLEHILHQENGQERINGDEYEDEATLVEPFFDINDAWESEEEDDDSKPLFD